MKPLYPFAAIVGQENVKMALILSAIDPKMGGVLVSGPKGSGKTTIIRALAEVLPSIECVEGCPFNCNPLDKFGLCPSCRESLLELGALKSENRRMQIVELPVSATEDGLLGTIDAEAAFQKGEKSLLPGLLGKANQSILYIDEVNLLPENLVNCILDPAASRWSIVQREGISVEHPSHFNLVASMNPEEGGLRPQILDRFAIKVDMDKILDVEKRVDLIRRNLSFEEDPQSFMIEYEEELSLIKGRIDEARNALESVEIPQHVVRGIADACLHLGVESLRSDISTLKASRALAAFEGRSKVDAEDVMRVLPLIVSHRIGDKVLDHGRLRKILFTQIPMKVLERSDLADPAEFKGLPETSLPSPEPRTVRKKGRRTVGPLHHVFSILLVAALLASMSIFSALMTLLLQAMFSGVPFEALIKVSFYRRTLLFLGATAILFALLSLFYRRVRRPVRYLYVYLAEGLERRIVHRQMPPTSEGEEEERTIRYSSGVVNIPLFASLRRLYKMVVGKGVKLLELKRKQAEKRYRFLLERKADRGVRSLIGRQMKTDARSNRGRYSSYEFPKSKPWDLAIGPTIRAAAPYQASRRGSGLALKVEVEDIRVKVREMKSPFTILLLLDLSESMVSSLENMRNAILSMRDVAFKRRDRVGLVVFKGQGASTLQSPTTNLSLLVKKLMEVGASDFTPLASGMYEAWRVLRNEKTKNRDTSPVLVIVSDGIANVPLEAPLSHFSRSRFLNRAQADVIDVAHLLNRGGVTTLVINPSHVPVGKVASQSYKEEIRSGTGKIWLEPTELLMQIPKISGGYYYGIGEEGDLEEVILTEALSVLSRR